MLQILVEIRYYKLFDLCDDTSIFFSESLSHVPDTCAVHSVQYKFIFPFHLFHGSMHNTQTTQVSLAIVELVEPMFTHPSVQMQTL